MQRSASIYSQKGLLLFIVKSIFKAAQKNEAGTAPAIINSTMADASVLLGEFSETFGISNEARWRSAQAAAVIGSMMSIH